MNRNLAIVSGPTRRVRGIDRRRSARVASSSANERHGARRRALPSVSDDLRCRRGTTAAIALRVARGAAREDQARRQHVEDVAQLAVVLRDERVGRRDRRDRARRRASRRARAGACSRSLSERITTGRSAERPRSSSACPIARALRQRLAHSSGAASRRRCRRAWRRACDRARTRAQCDQTVGEALRIRPRAARVETTQRRAIGAALEVRLERAAERQRPVARRVARRRARWRRAHAFFTLPARPSRKARTRSLAAVVALRDRRHQRFDEQAVVLRHARRCAAARASPRSWTAAHWRRSARQARSPCRGPCRLGTRYCEKPIARAFFGVVDAAGQHHVGHARGADQARNAHRAAAADEEAALRLRAGRRRRSVRRRGCGTRWRARARRRPPRRAAPRPPARGRTGSARTPRATSASGRCPRRRCASETSARSRPAQK